VLVEHSIKIKLIIPVATVSEANSNIKRRDKWKRKANQRQMGFIFAKNEIIKRDIDVSSMKLTHLKCIRHGKRKLDDDNLSPCFKAIIDGIASAFQVNDRDIKMEFEQTIKNKEPFTEVILNISTNEKINEK
jgi:hypothetical protein